VFTLVNANLEYSPMGQHFHGAAEKQIHLLSKLLVGYSKAVVVFLDLKSSCIQYVACACRLLELWQRVSSGGQAGFKLSLQTQAAFSQLSGSDPSGTALWALLKVIAAESPGTSVSGIDADASRARPSLPLHVSLLLPLPWRPTHPQL